MLINRIVALIKLIELIVKLGVELARCCCLLLLSARKLIRLELIVLELIGGELIVLELLIRELIVLKLIVLELIVLELIVLELIALIQVPTATTINVLHLVRAPHAATIREILGRYGTAHIIMVRSAKTPTIIHIISSIVGRASARK